MNSSLAAALEIFGALGLVAFSALLFAAGFIGPTGAAHLTLALLVALAALAWRNFSGGCHPGFFFLALLALFQGGRLSAWGPEADTEIFRVTLMTSTQFDPPRDAAGTVLAALALSAVAIYAVCRAGYRPPSPASAPSPARFLPFFYWLFALSLPVQLYKNYCYYAYARDHGGYLVFFVDHGGLAASVPAAVRAISLVSLPALVAILVLEERRPCARAAAAIYLAVAAPVLLAGSRGALFALVLALWYLGLVRSRRRVRLRMLALVASALMLVGALVGSRRIENGETRAFAGPAQFLADQGLSLNVTEVAVVYRDRFRPHFLSYLASELESAFVAADQANYRPGTRFSDDVAMFLNPFTYQLGFGGGSSYIAEAYVGGGLLGVVLASLAAGGLLTALERAARHPLGLFLVVLVLPDVLWMPRGGLADWISASLRVALSLLLLTAGWTCCRTLAWLGGVLAAPPPPAAGNLS